MKNLLYYDEIDSTNAEAKRLLRGGKDELYGTVITARRQTAGRGRLGRSFASPGGDSVYASFILKPPENPAEQLITSLAAVAVCLAIEKTTSYKPGIKWINDILVDGKKICGILAESVPGAVVLGIGVNVNLSEDDLPEELHDIAGSLKMDIETRTLFFDTLTEEVFRCMAIADTEKTTSLMDEYRERSVLLRKPVYIGSDGIPAFCDSIADDGALIVRYEDGSIDELRSGGISVRLV